MDENTELDFNSDDYNQFYYTNEKHISKMDDEFLLSKITEIYPDFKKEQDENILKQVLIVIFNDSNLISMFSNIYGIETEDFFKLVYRNYDFIFNKCFITKIQTTIKNKKYAKKISNGTDRKYRHSEKYAAIRRKRNKK